MQVATSDPVFLAAGHAANDHLGGTAGNASAVGRAATSTGYAKHDAPTRRWKYAAPVPVSAPILSESEV